MKPVENRLFGRPRRRWEDNIKPDHKDIGYTNINPQNYIVYYYSNKCNYLLLLPGILINEQQ
jgi:hypothetical protein